MSLANHPSNHHQLPSPPPSSDTAYIASTIDTLLSLQTPGQNRLFIGHELQRIESESGRVSSFLASLSLESRLLLVPHFQRETGTPLPIVQTIARSILSDVGGAQFLQERCLQWWVTHTHSTTLVLTYVSREHTQYRRVIIDSLQRNLSRTPDAATIPVVFNLALALARVDREAAGKHLPCVFEWTKSSGDVPRDLLVLASMAVRGDGTSSTITCLEAIAESERSFQCERVLSIIALGALGSYQSVPLLIYLGEPDRPAWIRESAQWALAHLEDESYRLDCFVTTMQRAGIDGHLRGLLVSYNISPLPDPLLGIVYESVPALEVPEHAYAEVEVRRDALHAAHHPETWLAAPERVAYAVYLHVTEGALAALPWRQYRDILEFLNPISSPYGVSDLTTDLVHRIATCTLPDDADRCDALITLAQNFGPTAAPLCEHLVTIVSARPEWLAERALKALVCTGVRGERFLVELAESPLPSVRAAALRQLLRTSSLTKEEARIARAHLADEDYEVRRAALDLLRGSFGDSILGLVAVPLLHGIARLRKVLSKNLH